MISTADPIVQEPPPVRPHRRAPVETPVLIVGAGPYGITLALELMRCGIRTVTCGEPFELWFRHTMTDVSLRSDIRASEIYTRDGRFNLPQFLRSRYGAERAAAIAAGRIPVRVFREYLRHVVDHLPFDVLRTTVVQLERQGDHFTASLADGQIIRCRNVVVATGIGGHRNLPLCLRSLASDRVMHGWFANSYEQLAGENLLIIGRGQSAGEAVSLLKQRNTITWVYRSPLIYFADPILLPVGLFRTALRVSRVFSYLPATLRRAAGKLFVGTTMTPDLQPIVEASDVRRVRCDAHALQLSDHDGRIHSGKLDQTFDRVIACTGYRPSVARLTFIAPTLRDAVAARDGVPTLNHHFASSVPGLYFVGGLAEPSHGPAQRFLVGARNAAIAVASDIRSRHSTHTEPTMRGERPEPAFHRVK